MLNKEFLLAGSESLEPVLSIYISPDVARRPSVSGTLSSGQSFTVETAGETTFKFSEIELTARICIEYNEDVQLSTSNLTEYGERPSREGISRVPAFMWVCLYVADPSQSASISLS